MKTYEVTLHIDDDERLTLISLLSIGLAQSRRQILRTEKIQEVSRVADTFLDLLRQVDNHTAQEPLVIVAPPKKPS